MKRHVPRPSAPPRSEPFSVDLLEPRVLLTAYAGQSAFDAYNLARLIHDVPMATEVPGNFGFQVAAVGDINGDGSPDFAISAPGVRGGSASPAFDAPWSGEAGAVFLYSGRDRTIIRTLTDDAPGFGAALLNVGDVNHDGVPDLAVGSPSYDSNPDDVVERYGRIWIYSGANGSVLSTLNGAGPVDELGWSLWSAGDYNNDGTPDLLAGAPGAGRLDGQAGPGRALVISLTNNSVLRTFNGEQDGDRFGHALGGGIDTPPTVNQNTGDRVPDYLIGAPGSDEFYTNGGRAYAFDGATGEIRYRFAGGSENALGGYSVAVVGYSGANTGDFLRYLVGAPGEDSDSGLPGGITVDAGRVTAYSASGYGVTGPNIQPSAGRRVGERITLLPSFDDFLGSPAYAVFSGGSDASPRVHLFHGDTSNISLIPTSRFVSEATSLGFLGDADADGVGDLLVVSAAASGLPVRMVPLPFTGDLQGVDAVSDNGRFAILGPYLSTDGQLSSIATLPGLLPGDRLLRVNNSGLFVGGNPTDPAYGVSAIPPDRMFFYDGSQRVTIAQATATSIGAPAQSLNVVALSNTGDAIFNGLTVPSGPLHSAYLFRAGVMRNLWSGSAAGISDTGVVVGMSNNFPVQFTRQRVVAPVPGMDYVGGISPSGDIVGSNTALDLVRLSASGRLTTLAAIPPLPPRGATPSWVVQDVSDSGQVLALHSYEILPLVGGRPTFDFHTRLYLFTPGVGVLAFDQVVTSDVPAAAASAIDRTAIFLADSRIRSAGNLYLPVADPAVNPVVQPGAAIASTTTAAGVLYTAFISTDSQAVVIRNLGADRRAQTLVLGDADGVPTASDVALYTDARDGQVYAIVRAGGNFLWYRPRLDGLFYPAVRVAPIIPPGLEMPIDVPTGPLTVFTTKTGRVYIVGLNDDGDIVGIAQTNDAAPGSMDNWGQANISDNLEVNGRQTPEFQGRLTAFVTPWNALNLIGLDAAGHAQAVWLAPGAAQWSVNDLSALSDAPALSGSLTAFVTPWKAMNVIGTDANGHPVAIWWVPAFVSQWRYDALSSDAAAPALDNATLSAFVTPWNAMSIIGRDRTSGVATTYWWSPATNRWTAEPLAASLTESGITFVPTITAGPTNSFMLGRAQTVLAVRASNSHLLRYHWNPGDGTAWSVEDLTPVG